MLVNNKIFMADLKLFDGAAAGTAGAGADAGSAAPGVSADTTGDKIPWHMLKGGKPSDVDAMDGGADGTNGNTAEGNPLYADSWEKAKEVFGEDYKKDIEKNVKRRLKTAQTDNDNLKSENETLKKLRDFVALKYPDVDKNDAEALYNAVKGDDSYLKQRALDNGTTVEQESRAYDRQVELEALREKVRQQEQSEALRRRAEDVMQQIAQVKEVYPDFDFEKANENEDFQMQMAFHQQVKGKPNVRAAYEAAFGDTLRKQAVHQTVDATKEAISHNLRANQYMPSTAGKSSSGTAPVSGFDISNISAKEIADRAYAGEDISKYFR